MDAVWTVWCDAKQEKSARKVAHRLLRKLDRDVQSLAFAPYPKTGGWTFTFSAPLMGTTWSEWVVDAVALGQRVGYQWTLYGSVLSDPSAWSARSRISGVTAAEWLVMRQDASPDADGDTDT